MLLWHEWGRGISNPVNPARGAFLRAKACVVIGHLHQTSQHTEPNLFGVNLACWSVGCLCDLHPKYRPINKWNHGFGVLHTQDKWAIENHKIENGKIV